MRKLCLAALMLWSCAQGASLTLYDDALRNGFGDSSWAQAADYDLFNPAPTYAGSADSIKFIARNWGGLQFIASGAEFNVADYQSLTFHINGGSAGGQKVQIYVCDNYSTTLSATYPVEALIAGGTIPKNAWATVTLDFDAVHMTYGTFNCLVIMDADGSNDAGGQPAVYIDQVVANARTTPIGNGGAVNVMVDISANVHPIDPLIFGVAFGDAARNAQIGYTVDRWGGNSTTRYNWQVDTDNKASDYLFLNEPEGSGAGLPANSTADQFISDALAAHAQPLLTIPTIGWTPKDRAKRPGFSIAKYGSQYNNECTINYFLGCDADAGDGYCDAGTNTTGHCNGGVITGNDPADTSISAPAIHFSASARVKAGWSMIGPRAVLIRNADGFIRRSSRSPISPRVDWFNKVLTVT